GKSAFSSPYFPTPGSRWHTSRPNTSWKTSTTGTSSRATRQICRMRRFIASVRIGDRQLVGREEGDDLGALGRDDHLFLDARRRDAVGCRAVRLDGEDHPHLELHRMLERIHP